MYKIILSLAAAAALALTIPAFAQQKADPKATEKKVEPKATEKKAEAKVEKKVEKKVVVPARTFLPAQEAKQYLARTRLLGQKVANKDGQTIGDIEDLIVNSGNEVVGVIMGVGGFLGVGEKKIGVRYAALKFATGKDGKTTVSLPAATKEVLAAVEPYKRADTEKTMLQKATDTAKGIAGKAAAGAKDLAKKASDAVKGTGDTKAKEEPKKEEPKKK